MVNERIEKALDWCKERGVKSEQLNLFDKMYIRELNKANKRAKRLKDKARKEFKNGD